MAETPERPWWYRLSPYLVAASVVVGFGVGIWVGTKRLAPPPQVIRVIENPNPEENRSNIVVESDVQGKLRGSVQLPRTANPPGNSGTPKGSKPVEDGMGSGDFQARVPMKGEIATRYKVDGKVVEEGIHPVKGESVVTKKGDQLTVDTSFTDTVEVAVELEKPKPKLWRVGIYTAYDDKVSYGGYVQRNIPLMLTEKLDLYGFFKAEVEKENETDVKVYAGIEANF